MSQASGTALTRFNAVRHGILSKHTVLPWEDADDYAALLAALSEEYAPTGPTEEHLVEELAGVIWRKRRLRMAEASAARRGLDHVRQFGESAARAALAHLGTTGKADWIADAIASTPESRAADLADLDADEAMTRDAIAILAADQGGAYEAALNAIRDDTREWWLDSVQGEPDAAGLLRFLEGPVAKLFKTHRRALETQPYLQEQAIGDAFDGVMVNRMTRYETHLDRKLERTLTMLIKLRDLRPDVIEA